METETRSVPPYTPQRPLPPQRSVSGSFALQNGLKRPPIPSRLSAVRSFSQPQPLTVIDLSPDPSKSIDARNTLAYIVNTDSSTPCPDLVDLTSSDEERPAKRAKTSGNAFRAQSSTSTAGSSPAHQRIPGSPLPLVHTDVARPGRSSFSKRTRMPVDAAARRAHGLDPPSVATRVPAPQNVIDFLPWDGNQPEDAMNEAVVKSGYYDKAPGPNSVESSSARSTIWPNLSQKNHMALQTLSYLFSQVMEKRQQIGKSTAPSTFKPPPRVTVTDTRREAWLRDLANPDVPLRRQSRTIPHGIRGKPLMEHCLVKEIPLPRAVWLAKCVGANELRAFRRKGVSGTTAASGESKWVRDWTVQVELFLENVIAECGKPDWQAKMDYAVRLATSFYSERLLDRDHYMEWIVCSFSQAAIDKLPIWIILSQLYWKDITGYGRRGKQLAEAILENLHQITIGNYVVNDALRDRLKKLVVVLAVSHKGCLILPKTWERYRHLLTPDKLSGNVATIENPVQTVLKRNFRLMSPLLKTLRNTRCPALELYSVLDDIGMNIDYHSVAATCMTKIQDVNKLIPAILDWTASVYRTGESRVYVGIKVIVHLYDRGIDTDATILEYLKQPHDSSLIVANVHRVVAELARVGCFFPGRYLQWLMTSGTLYSGNTSSLSAGLLTALPLDILPPHLLNTRHALMRRLGHKQEEGFLLSRLQADIDSCAEFTSSSMMKIWTAIDTCSESIKLELANRLTVRAATMVKEKKLTLQCFCALRTSLERCKDLPALAKLVSMAMQTDDAQLLATICDTMNLHATGFAAIERFRGMLDHLLERYRMFRTQQSYDRTVIISLIALFKRCADKKGALRQLESDLATCDQQSSLAVYSPASDNLVGMQATHLDSDDDIDAVFLSGNTMDEQLMQRVFTRIVQRASKPISPTENAPSKVCRWFGQLRSLDTACFDQLVTNFAQGCLQSPSDNVSLLKVLSAFVAGGSLGFDKLAELAEKATSSSAASVVIKMLTSKSIVNESLHTVEAFRFRAQQARFKNDCTSKVLPLLVSALNNHTLDLDDDGLAELLLHYSTLRDLEGTSSLLSNERPLSFLENFNQIMKKTHSFASSQENSAIEMSTKSIIELANPLSVVQCSAAVQYTLKLSATQESQDDDGLKGAIIDAVGKGCDVWPQLLEGAGQDTIKAVYRWAREQVMSNILRSDGFVASSTTFKRYLEVLDATHHDTADQDATSVAATVTEKLRSLENQLMTMHGTTSTARDFRMMMTSLQILLHLSVLFSTSSVADSETHMHQRAALVATLCSLLVHPKLQTQPAILEYIYDVASAVSDRLPLEVLTNLAKSASIGIARDPRLAFVLGSSQSPDAWLSLVTHSPPHAQPPGNPLQRTPMRQPSVRQVTQSPMAPQKTSVGSQIPGVAAQHQQGQARPHSPVVQHKTLVRPQSPVMQQRPPTRTPSIAAQQRAPPRPAGGMIQSRLSARPQGERKVVPFPLKRWEMMSDATPSIGDNDTSLSLSLFKARKV